MGRHSRHCDVARDLMQAGPLTVRSGVASVSHMGTVFGGMAMSLDGYIRSGNGDLSWLNDAMAKDEDYGFEATERRSWAAASS
jgi:hypothetical protein